jgi:serine/threonine protein kinase
MKKRIRLGQYDFPSPEWANVSQEAKSLIKGMLCIDPAERLQIDAVMRNNWIAVSKHYMISFYTSVEFSLSYISLKNAFSPEI